MTSPPSTLCPCTVTPGCATAASFTCEPGCAGSPPASPLTSRSTAAPRPA
ncbi:unnamed protein product [Menidia menidia]|uniref:(Atlantic silverside) hypothetical protein n=1 Tax=Menidia menidia TaxID=238744 RepID=A0A8S4AYX6_9TELE|nr:unnamed protein product [Menidia menidia]